MNYYFNSKEPMGTFAGNFHEGFRRTGVYELNTSQGWICLEIKITESNNKGYATKGTVNTKDLTIISSRNLSIIKENNNQASQQHDDIKNSVSIYFFRSNNDKNERVIAESIFYDLLDHGIVDPDGKLPIIKREADQVYKFEIE